MIVVIIAISAEAALYRVTLVVVSSTSSGGWVLI